jgi:phage replication-related protein YjqB (UPF0714/DUF867 family)
MDYDPDIIQQMRQAVSTEIDVLKAKSAMLDYLTEENCTIDDELRNTLGLSVGDQFRLTVKNDSSRYGLVTIHSDYEDGSDNNDIRMRLSGRQRFDETDSFDAYAEDWTPYTDKTDSWLNDNDEFGEFLEETSTTHSEVVFCAPHGGMIENYTDEMAQYAQAKVDDLNKDASAWYCIGHQDEIGAYDAWHITSTDISRNTFSLLDQIGDREFEYAVSFHGYGESDILVGGGAGSTLKNEVKTAIENVVGTNYDVEVVSSGPYAGTSSDNFVNWLTSSGSNGIQIELPYSARRDYGQSIAEAVATVFANKQS